MLSSHGNHHQLKMIFMGCISFFHLIIESAPKCILQNYKKILVSTELIFNCIPLQEQGCFPSGRKVRNS